MVGGNLLEGTDYVFDLPEIGRDAELELLKVFVGNAGSRDYEIAHTALVEVEDIAAAGVALGGDGEEKAAAEVAGMAAVGEELFDWAGRVVDLRRGAFENGGYLAGFHGTMIL